ncbi:hypothetical protein GCM10023201_07890 [Actinomycetospora corticicola]|uniref:Uncharacterized protein n=1 Tax=Actinomycetospora corticicola TaxID=663602 RepID=A0A7Y9DTR7_9PSEU|nr:hypothetical protein [Actinomycetospora corticicola]NYD35375.1 hypothetical protein [Actinomycetospora corticicola]
MRPWLLRALVMTVLYGAGQTTFVALSSRFVSLSLLWTLLLLGVLLLVGLVWGGAEVIADRMPPEWTWLKASLAAGPAAGLLTWILLASFVDATGVEDLGAALVGRASFTILLILASVSLGARFGWLSLRRADDPRADDDPGADVDLPAGDAPDAPSTVAGTSDEPPVLPASTTEKVAARRAGGRTRQPAAAPTGTRRPQRVPDDEPTRLPFGTGPFAERPGAHSPVVAVLPPVTPLPDTVRPAAADEPDEAPERPSRRRFGLRRPSDDEA